MSKISTPLTESFGLGTSLRVSVTYLQSPTFDVNQTTIRTQDGQNWTDTGLTDFHVPRSIHCTMTYSKELGTNRRTQLPSLYQSSICRCKDTGFLWALGRRKRRRQTSAKTKFCSSSLTGCRIVRYRVPGLERIMNFFNNIKTKI